MAAPDGAERDHKLLLGSYVRGLKPARSAEALRAAALSKMVQQQGLALRAQALLL